MSMKMAQRFLSAFFAVKPEAVPLQHSGTKKVIRVKCSCQKSYSVNLELRKKIVKIPV